MSQPEVGVAGRPAADHERVGGLDRSPPRAEPRAEVRRPVGERMGGQETPRRVGRERATGRGDRRRRVLVAGDRGRTSPTRTAARSAGGVATGRANASRTRAVSGPSSGVHVRACSTAACSRATACAGDGAVAIAATLRRSHSHQLSQSINMSGLRRGGRAWRASSPDVLARRPEIQGRRRRWRSRLLPGRTRRSGSSVRA